MAMPKSCHIIFIHWRLKWYSTISIFETPFCSKKGQFPVADQISSDQHGALLLNEIFVLHFRVIWLVENKIGKKLAKKPFYHIVRLIIDLETLYFSDTFLSWSAEYWDFAGLSVTRRSIVSTILGQLTFVFEWKI